MSHLLGRYCAVTVGTLRVQGLKMSIDVSKNAKPEPAKASVKIWNLNPEHRQQLVSSPRLMPVQIDAGYEDAYSTIFVGELRFGDHRREGLVDVVTTIESTDKGATMGEARVSATLPKGSNAGDVLRTVAMALGVGAGRSTAWGGAAIAEGNLNEAIALIRSNGIFASGTCLTGQAWREMTNVCRSLGLTWSVQNGKLQILKVGQGLAGQAIRLTPSTGLIGSPSVDSKGILAADIMMMADVFPGRVIVVESEFVKGQYIVDETQHVGEYVPFGSALGDWQIKMKAKPY